MGSNTLILWEGVGRISTDILRPTELFVDMDNRVIPKVIPIFLRLPLPGGKSAMLLVMEVKLSGNLQTENRLSWLRLPPGALTHIPK